MRDGVKMYHHLSLAEPILRKLPALKGLSHWDLASSSWSTFVQVIVCPLFSANPLPPPMLMIYYQMNTLGQTSGKILTKFKSSLSINRIKNVICKIMVILFCSQCVNKGWVHSRYQFNSPPHLCRHPVSVTWIEITAALHYQQQLIWSLIENTTRYRTKAHVNDTLGKARK